MDVKINRSKINPVFLRKSLLFFIFILLVLGVFFRIANLGNKIYWHDEVFTSLRVSGYTMKEISQESFTGEVIAVEQLQKYQRIHSQTTIQNTLNSIVREEPQMSPLYYIAVYYWRKWFGDSVAITRLLSALLSFLVFPAFYFLCQELFSKSIVGWIGVALITVCPFHVLYAQEARYYSLYTAISLLTSLTFLQAIRITSDEKLSSSIRAWLIHSIILTISLYTSLLTVVLTLSHGIYLLVLERFRLTKALIAFTISCLLAYLAFLPWIFPIINHWSAFESSTSWTKANYGLSFLIKKWVIALNYVFIDFDFFINQNSFKILNFLSFILIVGIVGYAFYFICRYTKPSVWLFIIILTGVPFLYLMLPDLIRGGIRSTSVRYLISCYLGIQLAVAYLLATKLSDIKVSQQQLWRGIMLVIVSAGVWSCFTSYSAETWWNKLVSYHNPQIAELINKNEQPLVISDNSQANLGNIISLSYLLKSKVRLQLIDVWTSIKIPKIPDQFSEIFVFYPSLKLRKGLENEYNLKLENLYPSQPNALWKLTKLT